MSNTLHFYGCSYTAGTELLDEEYAQRIEDLERHLDPEKSPGHEKHLRLSNERDELVDEKEERQKQLSWAGQLSTSLGLDYYNHAEQGNSLDNMRLKFYNHVINGKIDELDTVFIGATGYFRETRFYPLTDPATPGRSFGVSPLNDQAGFWAYDEEFARKYLEFKPPYVFLYQYMNTLRDIIGIAEKYDIRLYLVPCLEPISSQYFLDTYVPGHQLMSVEYEYMDSIRFMEKEINKYIITNQHMDAFVAASIVTKERLPGGHPSPHAHIRWAKYIASKIH